MTPRLSPRETPANTASCGGCEARWRGIGIAHCATCHRSFSGIRLFDKHRRRDRCVDPLDILDPQGYLLMNLIEGVWRGHADEAMRARLDSR